LHFLVSKEFAPLLRGFPRIDEVLCLDRAGFRSKNVSVTISNLLQLICKLRARKFSLAIDFQGYGETAWLSWMSGAPERWGGIYRFNRSWAYTRGVERDDSSHPAEGNLSLLGKCGLRIGEVHNEYILPADAITEAENFFTKNGLEKNKKTLFLQPFTSSPGKNWPLNNFLALARYFQPRFQIIFGGGPAERNALKPAQEAGFVIAAGAPLLVSAGLIKLSTLAVGSDTGLLHLAVAMGKRVVMLMPHEGVTTRPFRHGDWAMAPAIGKTISEITVEEMVTACESAINHLIAG
jgi:ADP-heptose:LPS heptosyltransferase